MVPSAAINLLQLAQKGRQDLSSQGNQSLPSSLDEFVPETLPTPSLLPKFQSFTEEELLLYQPLWMLSKGYTLPEDDFSRQLAEMAYQEQFRKEMELISFDAYRKNLEIRAEHDQRVRQLFAPIGHDFNTVFSSEAIQQALKEVIDAYKATNPRISWNRLSPDAKRREILRFMQQGRLPTLKRFAEQWGRLKANFQSYKMLLHPNDQMVVSELEGILGGSFEDFILKYLTLNDPEEEAQQRQLIELRRQHELMRRLMKEYPDLYPKPQINVPPTGGLGLGSLAGGGGTKFSGGGGGQPSSNQQGAVIDFRKYATQFVQSFSNPKGVDLFADPSIAGLHLSTLFTGRQGATANELVSTIRKYTLLPENRIASIVSKHRTVSGVMEEMKRLFRDAQKSIQNDLRVGTISPNTQKLVRDFSAYVAMTMLIDMQRQFPIEQMSPAQRDELMRSIHGSALTALLNNIRSQGDKSVMVGGKSVPITEAIADEVSVALGGRRGVSYDVPVSRAVGTGQVYEERVNAIRNAIRATTKTLKETAAEIGMTIFGMAFAPAFPGSSLSDTMVQEAKKRIAESYQKLKTHIDNTNRRLQKPAPSEIVIPLTEFGIFGTPDAALQTISQISEDELAQQIEEFLYQTFPQSKLTSMTGAGDKLKIELRLGGYVHPKTKKRGIAFYLFISPSSAKAGQKRRGK